MEANMVKIFQTNTPCHKNFEGQSSVIEWKWKAYEKDLIALKIAPQRKTWNGAKVWPSKEKNTTYYRSTSANQPEHTRNLYLG